MSQALQAAQGGRLGAQAGSGGQSDARACKAPFIIATPGTVLEWASRGRLFWKNVYACIFDEAPDLSGEAEMVYALCKQDDSGPTIVTLSASPSCTVLKDAGQNVVKFCEERKYPLARFQPISAGRLSDRSGQGAESSSCRSCI